MEFWGVAITSGKPITVKPDEDHLIHLSQASLENGKKGETVVISVTVDGKRLVIGTLIQDTIPQIAFDLAFEKDFELSHNAKNGTVHFTGYKSPNFDEEEEDYFCSDSDEEEAPVAVPIAPKPKAVVAEVKADVKEVEDVDEDDDSSDDEDDSDDSEEGMEVDEEGSEDDSDDEEEEETPVKVEPVVSKKRGNESVAKTPASSGKKAKVAVTPQKTEEKKKGGHTATPHPAKKGGKSPNANQQSPKSGGSNNGSNKGKQFGGSNNKGKQFGGGSNNKGKGKGRN